MTQVRDDTGAMDGAFKKFKQIKVEQPGIGKASICKNITHNEIDHVVVYLLGRLPTYRSKELNGYKDVVENHIKCIKPCQEKWVIKLIALNLREPVEKLVEQCRVKKIRLKIDMVSYRLYRAKEDKNLITGADHVLLDGMVNAGMLIDDSNNHIIWQINSVKPQPEIMSGAECAYLRFQEERA